MLERFRDYFRAIEMPESLQDRAEKLCNEYATLINGEITNLFVDDRYEDDVRRYGSLFIVADGILSEFREFISQDYIDFTEFDGIKFMIVKKSEFAITERPTLKSTVEIDVSFDAKVAATFHAVYNNCAYLWKFAREILLPRFKHSDGSPLQSI